MKKVALIFIVGFVLISCKGPGGDKAEVSDAKETATASSSATDHSVNTEKSIVTWVGSKPAGKHNGTINVSEGTIHVEEGEVSSGRFVMDMNTVESTDSEMPADKNARLTKHLKDGDFFNVGQYPTSTFEIVSVDDISERASAEALKLEGATHYVTGNLTLKETTKAVSFPAILSVSDAGVTAKALFNIDRTDWGMHYKSDKSFGDQIIHPQVEVGFNIVSQ